MCAGCSLSLGYVYTKACSLNSNMQIEDDDGQSYLTLLLCLSRDGGGGGYKRRIKNTGDDEGNSRTRKLCLKQFISWKKNKRYNHHQDDNRAIGR